MKAGDTVFVRDSRHPHHTATGILMAYEKYGPAILDFEGWRVRDREGNEFYAKPDALRIEKRVGS